MMHIILEPAGVIQFHMSFEPDGHFTIWREDIFLDFYALDFWADDGGRP